MKRLSLIALLALLATAIRAQIPDPGDPVCAYCEVNLKTGEAHKRGCPYYSEPSNEESSSSVSSSSASSSSKPSGPSRYNPFADGTCPECGAKVETIGQYNRHRTDCRLGNAFREYYRLWDVSLHGKKKKERDEAWRKMQDAYERAGDIAEQAIKRKNSGVSTPSYSTPSTHLRDYTPMPENKPAPQATSKPEPPFPCPIAQQTPSFSSVNEESVIHNELQSLEGQHSWGEIDMEALAAYNKQAWDPIPMKFRYEDYTLTAGHAVVLGFPVTDKKGQVTTIAWHIFVKGPNGKYIPAKSLQDQEHRGRNPKGNEQTTHLRSVSFACEGTFIVKEYENNGGGYYKEIILTRTGEIVKRGYNISFPGYKVDGKRLILGEPDWSRGSTIRDLYYLYNEEGKSIVHGDKLTFYDDAIIVKSEESYELCNWYGERFKVPDGDWKEFFADVKAYNDNGSYYIIETKDHHFALVGRGFKRIGGLYNTEEEARAAWPNRR